MIDVDEQEDASPQSKQMVSPIVIDVDVDETIEMKCLKGENNKRTTKRKSTAGHF